MLFAGANTAKLLSELKQLFSDMGGWWSCPVNLKELRRKW